MGGEVPDDSPTPTWTCLIRNGKRATCLIRNAAIGDLTSFFFFFVWFFFCFLFWHRLPLNPFFRHTQLHTTPRASLRFEKKSEHLDKSSKPIDILPVFFELEWSGGEVHPYAFVFPKKIMNGIKTAHAKIIKLQTSIESFVSSALYHERSNELSNLLLCFLICLHHFHKVNVISPDWNLHLTRQAKSPLTFATVVI